MAIDSNGLLVENARMEERDGQASCTARIQVNSKVFYLWDVKMEGARGINSNHWWGMTASG